jgi:hypothetical protein
VSMSEVAHDRVHWDFGINGVEHSGSATSF